MRGAFDESYSWAPRRVARNSQWGGGCLWGLGAEPPAAGGQWGLGAKPAQPPEAGGLGVNSQPPEARGSGGGAPALKKFAFFAKITSF